MPHKCVRCGKLIDDGSREILSGCGSCGGKLFFFIKKSRLDELQKHPELNLTDKEKKQIESDVYDIVGPDYNEDAPIVLNFESIRITKPGKFEIDLMNLLDTKRPLVYKLEEGKYMIDVPTTFEHAALQSKKFSKTKKRRSKK